MAKQLTTIRGVDKQGHNVTALAFANQGLTDRAFYFEVGSVKTYDQSNVRIQESDWLVDKWGHLCGIVVSTEEDDENNIDTFSAWCLYGVTAEVYVLRPSFDI